MNSCAVKHLNFTGAATNLKQSSRFYSGVCS